MIEIETNPVDTLVVGNIGGHSYWLDRNRAQGALEQAVKNLEAKTETQQVIVQRKITRDR